MKMAVFWVVAPCSLVEDSHLHTRRCGNLKSHLKIRKCRETKGNVVPVLEHHAMKAYEEVEEKLYAFLISTVDED
jgi:hypothetical protein